MGKITDRIVNQADTNARWYAWSSFEHIAAITDDRKEVRKDYETHSVVLIDRFDDKGKNVEIQLIDADSFRHLGTAFNRDNYMLLVHYTGSGKDAEAIGTVVRKKLSDKRIKQVRNTNVEVM